MSSSNCCFLTCIQISQEAVKVVWYSHLFQNFPWFIVIHTVEGFGIVSNVFLVLSCFFCNPANVGNLISGSSAFSKTSLNIWSSRFTYCWSLASEFWALLYQPVRWVQLCSSFSIPWHCLSLGLEWKLTFTSLVATADFSKFAGILSATL